MSADGPPRTSTGAPALDDALGGGLPAGRAVVLAGPPATGKRPLARAFLRSGAADEDCVLATATTGDTVPGLAADDVSVVALGGNGALDAVEELLGDDPDRVVVDLPGATDRETARAVLGRLAEADATGVLVADESGAGVTGGDHGLLRTSGRGRGPQATVRVARLPGVAYDDRPVELHVTTDGVRAGPTRRAQPDAVAPATHRPTGVPGLDGLCGGGLVQGDGTLLRHDGRAELGVLLAALLARAVRDGFAVELVPTLDLRARRLRDLLAGYDASLSELLDADRLFVLDVIGSWPAGRTNVFAGGDEEDELKAKLRGIADRTDRPHLRVVNADAMVHTLGPAGARELRYFQETDLLGDGDVLLHVQNPDVVRDEMAALYQQAATQVLETTLTDDGRQHVALRKSPTGRVGAEALLGYREEPPFVGVTSPPSPE